MQYLAELGNGEELKFYYNKLVYNPKYSSIDTAILANGFIFGKIKILDIATGCGITGLILKRIHPELDVTLADNSLEAIRVAKLNSKRLGLPVKVVEADLIPDNEEKYHVITANLPTYDSDQMRTEEKHGPDTAYYGGADGLTLYKRLFKMAHGRCVVLVCEIQKKHRQAFVDLAQLNGWKVAVDTDNSFALIES